MGSESYYCYKNAIYHENDWSKGQKRAGTVTTHYKIGPLIDLDRFRAVSKIRNAEKKAIYLENGFHLHRVPSAWGCKEEKLIAVAREFLTGAVQS